jgi:hypothetical protein
MSLAPSVFTRSEGAVDDVVAGVVDQSALIGDSKLARTLETIDVPLGVLREEPDLIGNDTGPICLLHDILHHYAENLRGRQHLHSCPLRGNYFLSLASFKACK